MARKGFTVTAIQRYLYEDKEVSNDKTNKAVSKE